MADLIGINFPIPYEPKKKNRWLIRMNTRSSSGNVIQEWVFSKSQRPTFIRKRHNIFWSKLVPDTISIELVDPMGPSTSALIYNFVENDYKLDYEIELLDPTGVVVEKWYIKEAEILEANFGDLSYEDDKPCKCKLLVKPKTAKLVF